MSVTYTESTYFLPDQYPCPCMQSGLQFVIGLLLLALSNTSYCKEDLMYLEQDTVVVMK